jgi:hypothetical protein
MPKLTYWLAEQHTDSPCYSIIAKTKKACLEQVADRPDVEYEPPRKVEIVYTDAFDLFSQATSESGGRHMW